MDLRESRSRDGLRHPWERARLAFLLRVLGRHDALGARRVLDVGSGDAWLAGQLLERLPFDARLVAVDAHYTPDVVASLALPRRIEAGTTMPDGPFDLCTALDVTEHVVDDRALVGELVSRLASGGTLLFTVPAWPALWSRHDESLGHERRYTHEGARRLLRGAGLDIVEDGGFFHSLVAARAVAVVAEKLTPAKPADAPETAFRGPPLLAEALVGTFELEHRLTHALARRGRSIPGLSYYALARRPR